MTAETLKPFITPTSAVNNFPAKHSGVTQPTKRKIKNLIPIVLCIIAVALVIGIFGLTVSVCVFFFFYQIRNWNPNKNSILKTKFLFNRN